MEALVKYEYLCDSFGKKKTNSAIKESGLEMVDLYDPGNFNIVAEILNESSI
jgi:hypothetical protein